MLLSTEDLIYYIDDYEEKLEEFGVEPAIKSIVVSSVTESFDNLPQKYKDQINLVKNGDYSNFNNMPAFLRNYLGALEIKKCIDTVGDLSFDNPVFTQYLKDNATNPVFRAGVSAGREDDKIQRASDEYMSRYLLEKTLMPPTEEEKSRVINQLGEKGAQKALEENLAKQRIIAKTLFMAQLGTYVVRKNEKEEVFYDEEISNTIVHGGRTNFVLPYGGDQTAVMNAFISKDDSRNADVYGRATASHTVKRKKVHQEGLELVDTKEEKPTFIGYFRKHYGMDFSAGGMGSLGANKNVVLSNGSNGHMYLRMEKGDSNHCGSLLIGFESGAPSKTTPLGHKQTMLAKSSRQTCFLSNKGGVGKNTDGRVVNLSGLRPEDFVMVMTAFDRKYAELQREVDNPAGRETLKNVNKILCGKRLERDLLVNLLKGMGVPDENIERIATFGREGRRTFEGRFDPKTMSKEECEDLMRKEISTDEACSTAAARYRASNSLTNAVGAIKELQKIHDTRGFFWKLFHPRMNAKEKATIKELINKLCLDSEKKGYSPNQILREFTANTDTYLLKYETCEYTKGVSLLNRHDGQFIQNPNQAKLDEKFIELGEKVKGLVMRLRDIRYDENKIRFEQNAKEIEPTLASQKVQKKIDKDKVGVQTRAENDYDMLVEEARDLKIIAEESERSVVEDNALDGGNLLYVERENIIVEEAEFKGDMVKSVKNKENKTNVVKEISSKN